MSMAPDSQPLPCWNPNVTKAFWQQPRYHFNTEDGKTVTDEVGSELDNIRAARVEAVRLLGDVISHQPDEVLATKDFKLTVTDDGGLILFTLNLHAHDSAATLGLELRAQ